MLMKRVVAGMAKNRVAFPSNRRRPDRCRLHRAPGSRLVPVVLDPDCQRNLWHCIPLPFQDQSV